MNNPAKAKRFVKARCRSEGSELFCDGHSSVCEKGASWFRCVHGALAKLGLISHGFAHLPRNSNCLFVQVLVCYSDLFFERFVFAL